MACRALGPDFDFVAQCRAGPGDLLDKRRDPPSLGEKLVCDDKHRVRA